MTVAATTPAGCNCDCPTIAELRDLLTNERNEANERRLIEHLDHCTDCQQLLEEAATSDSSVLRVVEHLDRDQPTMSEPYWAAIRAAEHAGQVTRAVPPASAPQPSAFAETFVPESPLTAPSLKDLQLDFLQPPTDPAYLGRLDHFDIARVIGRGGMGVVLEAFDTHLRRSVAIKVLDPKLQENELARQRFCREARAVAAIAHEHVVAMHQVAKAEGDRVPYLVMQLVQGESLEARLAREGRLPVKDVLRIGMQVAAGLAAAHAQGLVHRDIKPGNILLEAPHARVKLTDFGLARMAEDVKITQTGFVTGTPLYMAPEQALGEQPDERADLFSLGAVLYEAATGRAPFAASTVLAVLKKITDEKPLPLKQACPEMPEGAAVLIDQLLAKRPADRPVSATAIAEAFAVILTSFGPLSPLQIPAVAEDAACEAVQAALSKSGQTVCTRKKAKVRLIYGLLGAVIGVALAVLALPYLSKQPSENSTGQAHAPSNSDQAGGAAVSKVTPAAVLAGNAGPVWAVAFTPDGNSLAMAIDDGTVKVWDVATKRVRSTIKALSGPVWGMSLSHNGQQLAVGGDDGKVRVFDMQSTMERATLDLGYAIRTLAFAPQQDDLLIGGRTGQVEVWNVVSKQRTVATSGHEGTVVGVAFAPDGRSFASVSGDKTARIWNAQTGGEQLVLSGHSGGIYGVAFSTDGSRIVTGGWDKTVRLWDTASGTLEHTCEGHGGDVWAVAFSKSTPYAASVGEDRIARVWNTERRAEVAALSSHTGTLYAVTFSNDGRRLATAGRDGTARIWEMRDVE